MVRKRTDASRKAPEPVPDSRLQLLQLADDLASIRRRFGFEASPPVASPAPERWTQRLKGLLRRDGSPTPARHSAPGSVRVDDPLDTQWSHAHPALNSLAHVFHQEWHGIRAAAGYLPGTKLAITSERPLSVDDLRGLGETVLRRGSTAVLFHGWSPNALMAAHALRAACGARVKLLAVWHGNTAQFMNPFELKQVSDLVQLKRKGTLDALGSVKPDFHLVDEGFHREVLLNVGPFIEGRPLSVRANPSDTALIPVPNDWRKNYFTNLFGASAAGVRVTYVTSPLPKPFGFKLKTRVVEVARPSRAEFFGLLSQIGLILNASLSECQPMTALEGLVHGVPCLTGPLSLGALDEHPYQKLAQLGPVDTVGPVSRAARTLLDLKRRSATELGEMMADYYASLTRAAWLRLEEFTE